MKKEEANKHTSPMQYRVTWRGENSVEKSTSYYSGFHSSEALDFLAHTLRSRHIHTKLMEIIAIEEWCRFRKTWLDRLELAVKFCKSKEVGESIIILDQAEEISNG